MHKANRQCDLEGEQFIITKWHYMQPPDSKQYPESLIKDGETELQKDEGYLL